MEGLHAQSYRASSPRGRRADDEAVVHAAPPWFLRNLSTNYGAACVGIHVVAGSSCQFMLKKPAQRASSV